MSKDTVRKELAFAVYFLVLIATLLLVATRVTEAHTTDGPAEVWRAAQPRFWTNKVGINGMTDAQWGPANITKLYAIYSNHLDVGFDGIDPIIGFAHNVINKYFDVYFPLALNVTATLREMGTDAQMIWTTHPWLIELYLNCTPYLADIPINCPNQTSIDAFIGGINDGRIAWHAFPFNTQPEIIGDASLFQYAVSIAQNLDRLFPSSGNVADTMSQRDVPGMTRGVVPLLKSLGIQAISVGVNSGSAPPVVPPAFVWKDVASDQAILAMWHPGGYGGIGVTDCIIIPGFEESVAFVWNGDNAGPYDVNQVNQTVITLQSEFPNAKIVASTFHQYVESLATVQSSLPEVTSEIGDTWIHGVASDPVKLSLYREMTRLRSACLESGACSNEDPAMQLFNLLLIKNAEHTWGLDVKTFLHDWANWTNVQFEAAKGAANYQLMVQSWVEQRAFLYDAITAIGEQSPLGEAILAAIETISNLRYPNTTDLTLITETSTIFDAGRFSIGFNSTTGGIGYLLDTTTNYQWARSDVSLMDFVYRSISSEDYTDFLNTYLYCDYLTDCTWASEDYGKPNLTEANPQDILFYPQLTSLWTKKLYNGGFYFLSEMSMPSESFVTYGAPQNLTLEVVVSADNITVSLQLWSKTPTKLPEGLFFSFQPNITDTLGWSVNKLGSTIQPFDVVNNGSGHQHAIQNLYYVDADKDLAVSVTSHDAMVISFGEPNPFPTPLAPNFPDPLDGAFWDLYNNIWGTNYIMWYPYLDGDQGNLLFRFTVGFG